MYRRVLEPGQLHRDGALHLREHPLRHSHRAARGRRSGPPENGGIRRRRRRQHLGRQQQGNPRVRRQRDLHPADHREKRRRGPGEQPEPDRPEGLRRLPRALAEWRSIRPTATSSSSIGPASRSTNSPSRGSTSARSTAPTPLRAGSATSASKPTSNSVTADAFGIAVDSNGYLYVTDDLNHVVQIYGPAAAEPEGHRRTGFQSDRHRRNRQRDRRPQRRRADHLLQGRIRHPARIRTRRIQRRSPLQPDLLQHPDPGPRRHLRARPRRRPTTTGSRRATGRRAGPARITSLTPHKVLGLRAEAADRGRPRRRRP